MTRRHCFTPTLFSLLLLVGPLSAAVTGLWNFDQPANPLAGAVGDPIEYLDGPGGDTEAATVFGLTSDLGIPDINGEPAAVMGFPQTDQWMGYLLHHGIAPNGGGWYVNQWTIIMDVLFPASSTGVWRALIQTDTFNFQDDDAEFYLNESNGLGISNAYHGNVPADTWVRLAIAVDLTRDSDQITKYINGVKVGTNTGEFDSRFGLNGTDLEPDDAVLLFTDGYFDGPYSAPGYVASIQARDLCMTDLEIAALGGPQADGIPTNPPAQTVVTSFTPQDGQLDHWPDARTTITIEDLGALVDVGSVELFLDDNPVTVDVVKSGTTTTVTFQSDTLLPPGSQHSLRLSYADNQSTLTELTHVFTVVNYTNIFLPEPLFFEDFDGVAETDLPAGWTAWNLSDPAGWDPGNTDPQDLGSAVFADWTVIDSTRFTQPMITYGGGDPTDDYQRVLTPNPANVVNGEVVDNLASGQMLFGNTGYRNGDVVIYITSPVYDLSSAGNVYLAFHNIYEQNQDNLGALEYTTDGGATWLPILYMVDQEEVAAGPDVVAVLTAPNDDQVVTTDPVLGPAHGDFIGAPITEALAPYLSGRIDDDPAGSKRVEFFRLADADQQGAVQFRFVLTGTDSWYWGIDNFGIYSLSEGVPPVILTQPTSQTRHIGDSAEFSVVVQSEGPVTYQWMFNGTPLDGVVGPGVIVNAVTDAEAGVYTVAVTNAVGTTLSNPATLTVLPAVQTVFGRWDFALGDLTPIEGTCVLDYADGETSGLVAFETTGGGIPNIGGQPADFIRIPAFTNATNGLHGFFTDSTGDSGGEYLNQYTLIFDMLIPGPLNWMPIFNTNPANENDADWYVDDAGALGIAELGYTDAGTIQPDQWQRVAFVADLGLGLVRYYVDGVLVYQRTGGSLLDGGFSLYTGQHEGPDLVFFNEPSGLYTHEVLVSSMFIINDALAPEILAAMGGPTAAGIEIVPVVEAPEVSIAFSGGKVVVTWDGAGRLEQAVSANGPWTELIGATSPMQVEPTAAVQFYRVVR